MANRPHKPCKNINCNNLTRDKTGYCTTCKPDYLIAAHEREKARKREWDKHRPRARERGYNSRWEKARKKYLRKYPLCIECKREGKIRPATVVDHIMPHKGNKKLFWDKGNWQPLCTHHHNVKTATQDGGYGNE